MKKKAPKRKATKFVLQTCPHCGNEGYYCDDIESANPAKRKPLPKELVQNVKTVIAYLAATENEDFAEVVRSLLRRAGGGK